MTKRVAPPPHIGSVALLLLAALMQGVAGCGSAEEAGTGDADLSVDVGDRLIVLDDSVVVPSYALPAGFLLAVDRYKNYGGEPVVLLSDRDPNAVRSDGTANLDTPSYNRTGVVFVVEDYEEWGSVSVRMLGRHGGEQDVLAAESAGTLGGSRPTLGDAVGDSEWTHTFTASVGRVFQGDIASSKYGKLGYMVDPAIGATVNVRLLTERDGGDLSRVVLGMSGALAGTAQLRLTAQSSSSTLPSSSCECVPLHQKVGADWYLDLARETGEVEGESPSQSPSEKSSKIKMAPLGDDWGDTPAGRAAYDDFAGGKNPYNDGSASGTEEWWRKPAKPRGNVEGKADYKPAANEPPAAAAPGKTVDNNGTIDASFPVFLQAVPVLLGAVPGLVGVRAELSCQFAMGGEVNTVVDLGELEFGGEVECKVGSTGIPSCGIQNVAFTTRAEAKLSELKLKFGGRFECGPKISADLLVGGLVSFDVNALATVNGCAETAVDLTSLDVGSAFQLDTRAAAWVGGSAGLWWLGQKKWMVTAYDSGCTKLL